MNNFDISLDILKKMFNLRYQRRVTNESFIAVSRRFSWSIHKNQVIRQFIIYSIKKETLTKFIFIESFKMIHIW